MLFCVVTPQNLLTMNDLLLDVLSSILSFLASSSIPRVTLHHSARTTFTAELGAKRQMQKKDLLHAKLVSKFYLEAVRHLPPSVKLQLSLVNTGIVGLRVEFCMHRELIDLLGIADVSLEMGNIADKFNGAVLRQILGHEPSIGALAINGEGAASIHTLPTIDVGGRLYAHLKVRLEDTALITFRNYCDVEHSRDFVRRVAQENKFIFESASRSEIVVMITPSYYGALMESSIAERIRRINRFGGSFLCDLLDEPPAENLRSPKRMKCEYLYVC